MAKVLPTKKKKKKLVILLQGRSTINLTFKIDLFLSPMSSELICS